MLLNELQRQKLEDESIKLSACVTNFEWTVNAPKLLDLGDVVVQYDVLRGHMETMRLLLSEMQQEADKITQGATPNV